MRAPTPLASRGLVCLQGRHLGARLEACLYLSLRPANIDEEIDIDSNNFKFSF